MKRKLIAVSLLCLGATAFFSSCASNSARKGRGANVSRTTGMPYNSRLYGGFPVNIEYKGMVRPPGMLFIQGGRFTMGAVDDEMPTLETNNTRRTVSVSSFYMDETELENVSYREYMYWLSRAYGNDYPELVVGAKPDSTVWRSALAYNEPFVKFYFASAAYDHYPVVGVNWYQANDYCKWRTNRINEQVLIENGILKVDPNQSGEDVFNVETYQYKSISDGGIVDLDPNGAGRRPTNYGDGILLPDVRLPTEAEWEYAALGLVGNNPTPETKRRRGEEVITDRNTLPWGPKNNTRYGLRNQYQGEFQGNFMRAQGDVMGLAGGLNDNADIPTEVKRYMPNAFGLYNMAGNVNEWVLDTYRPNSHADVEGFRPFRGNEYKSRILTEDFTPEEPDSIGNAPYRNTTDQEILANGRYETQTGRLHNYKDGDSLIKDGVKVPEFSYAYGTNTLINDSTKVYKGGSWADRAYWMSPGTRRYRQGTQGSSDIGFRCVMDFLGSPSGNIDPGGNSFGRAKHHKR